MKQKDASKGKVINGCGYYTAIYSELSSSDFLNSEGTDESEISFSFTHAHIKWKVASHDEE